MAVLRSDIERALNELISNEGGMAFQGLAVVLGKLRWPELIAQERHKDFGLDAYAGAGITPDRELVRAADYGRTAPGAKKSKPGPAD
jgi:hypothetical protein